MFISRQIDKYSLIISLLVVLLTQDLQAQNFDFEEGNFNGWTIDLGTRVSPTLINYGTINGNIVNQHIRLMGPSTPPNDEYDILCNNVGIPTSYPGGLFSALVGNNDGGKFASRISKTFTVVPSTTFLQYHFAVILQDPGHDNDQQPKFIVAVKDTNGDALGCGKFEVFAGPNASSQGFINCNYSKAYRCDFPITECPNSPDISLFPNISSWDVQVLPWTTGAVDLSPFIGQDVTVEFIALDCTEGGHGASAYVEVSTKSLEIVIQGFCSQGDSITLNAPIGFNSYIWSTGDTTQTITVPNAQFGDIYNVDLISNTGCPTSLSITLTPEVPATIDVVPNQEICYSGSALIVPNGSGTLFEIQPSGEIGTSFVVNPIATTTYTITALNSNGCPGESTNVTIGVLNSNQPPFPVADFDMIEETSSSYLPCNAVRFINQSGYCKGTLDFEWDFGDGSPISTEENPVHTYLTDNSQNIYFTTLTVTSVEGYTHSKTIEFKTDPMIPLFSVDKFSFGCGIVEIIHNNTQICGMPYANFDSFVYRWDFGDGSPIAVTDEIIDRFKHTYSSNGQYPITLAAEHLGSGQTFVYIVNVFVTSANNSGCNCLLSIGGGISLDTNCNQTNGSITGISTSGNSGSETYSWTDGDGNQVGTTINLSGVGQGSYTLMVTDNSCTAMVGPFAINENRAATLDDSNVQFADADCGQPNGGITGVTTSGNPGSETYSWADTSGVEVATTIDLLGVGQGSYTLTVTDSGCTDMVGPFTINENGSPILDDSNIQLTNTDCGQAKGSITGITITGNDSNETYYWTDGDGNQIANTLDLIGVGPGIYLLIVDKGACTTTSGPYTLIEEGAPMLDDSGLDNINADCDAANGSISGITISGNSGSAVYEWTDQNGSVVGSSFLLNGIGQGTYTLRVTDQGCSAFIGPYTIDEVDNCQEPEPSSIRIATAMTPNGDGSNDMFMIVGLENYPDNRLYVFNR